MTAKKARSMKGAPAKVPTSLVKMRDGDKLAIGAKAWDLVYDQELNLYWPKDVTAVDVTHEDALAAAKAFTNKWLTAQSLSADAPTRRQLLSLVDDTRFDPAIDVRFFPRCPSRYFWDEDLLRVDPRLFVVRRLRQRQRGRLSPRQSLLRPCRLRR